ncbi:cytochrome P450 [Gigaspora margarita]|uniref:Cytochrome P450 n=1 Tax=Gigaspora margarita TaxID=4874 RepID=A0A8H4EGU1_GIGMA|nr:cytochrome P450 [Gigaspora margarita]
MNFEISLQDLIRIVGIFASIYVLKCVYDIIYIAYFGPLSKIPGPKVAHLTKFYIGVKQISGQRWKWLQNEIMPKYGKIVRVSPDIVVFSDKDIVKQFLVTNEMPKNKNYERLRIDEKYSTLFTARDKELHKRRRRILSPAFSIKHLSSLEPFMHTCINDLIAKIDGEICKNGGKAAINIYLLIQYNALDIIGETAFGGSFKMVTNGNHPMPAKVFGDLKRRVLRSLFPLLKPFLKQDPYLVNFTNKIIKQRRQESSQKKDLLQMMLDTKQHADGLSDFEIYDQSIEFLIAGSDTTSFTATMIMIMLVKHPKVLEKLIKEIDETLVGLGSEEIPTHDKIKHLPYLNGVINEGLRLFPTSRDFGPGKEATEDLVLGGYFIPKGTLVISNTLELHTSKEYWGENAKEFVPERWLEPEKLTPDCFIPFSAGARNCIGLNFAWMELRLTIATLLHRYNFKDIENQEIELLQFITPSLKSKEYNLIASMRN